MNNEIKVTNNFQKFINPPILGKFRLDFKDKKKDN